ncbi:hypothetical protein [Bdellovibrio sp.]|uniref:hypothetical protein n=1 Tax=Bdellovibrio sp. TaxID=28201 RepID=UPI0039E3212B
MKIILLLLLSAGSIAHAAYSQDFKCIPTGGSSSSKQWSLTIFDPSLPSFNLTSPEGQTSQGSMGTEGLMDYDSQCKSKGYAYLFKTYAYPFKGSLCCIEK